MVKWDNKVIKILYNQSKSGRLSESERELYFWIAQNRNNILKILLRSNKPVFHIYDHKTTNIKGKKVTFKHSKHAFHWVVT